MTPAERNAIGFFALLAAAGAGARALGLGDPPGARPPTPADRLALQHQLAVVDSAHAERERARGAKRGRARAGHRRSQPDSTRHPSAQPPVATDPAAQGPVARGPVARQPQAPVDVNAADSAALEALPGVGPALAHRILADRAAHGPYASMTDLSRVPGIGAALERRLAPTVTFTPGGRPSSGFVPALGGAHRVAPTRWPAP